MMLQSLRRILLLLAVNLHLEQYSQSMVGVESSLNGAVASYNWVSPELQRKNETIDADLHKPFEEDFVVGVGRSEDNIRRTLHTCSDYLSIRTDITDMGPSVMANVLRVQGTHCDALDLLSHAHVAPRRCFTNFTFAHLTVRNLPAALSLMVSKDDERAIQEASREGLPLTAVAGNVILRPVSRYEATLGVPSRWSSRLTVLASADFLGDGREELMVRSKSSVTGGTYQTAHLYLLGCASRSKVLPVIRQR